MRQAVPKVAPGQVVATPSALDALARAGQAPDPFVRRHLSGDWGDVCSEDAALNDQALLDGSRLLSAYRLATGETLWVITEGVGGDGLRPATTLLLPEEY